MQQDLNNIRGIEHIGITVPNLDEALVFFKKAFGITPLMTTVRLSEQPISAKQVGSKNGLADGVAITALTMVRLGNGPNIELFEIDYPKKTEQLGIAHLCISHFSVRVENLDAMRRAFEEAGGTLLEGPYDLFGKEKGEGNRGSFGITPWGLLIEFEQFKSPFQYDEDAKQQRWLP